MQNSESDIIFQTQGKRSNRKLINTPGSKRKDSLVIQESHKKRKSLHDSCRRNYARMSFKNVAQIKKQKGQIKNTQETTINHELAIKIKEMGDLVDRKNNLISSITSAIMYYQSQALIARKTTEGCRKKYLQSKQMQRLMNNQIDKMRQNCYALQSQRHNLQYQVKKMLYQVASQQNNLNIQIDRNKQLQVKRQRQLQRCLQNFQVITQKVAITQNYQKDLIKQYEESESSLKQISKNYNIELSQIFVLRFQLNSNMYSGFMVNSQGIDKRMILQKQYTTWDRTKQKKTSYQDLKRFILIQLYRGWKNMIRKLSYQSSQYQVLFGQISNQVVLNDLKRFLSEDKPRHSTKKLQKAIVFYSNGKYKTNKKQIILKLLQGFKNGIIEIKSVQFVQFQSQVQLQIKYKYLDEEILTQKYTYEDHFQIDKQKVVKQIKSSQRRIFCLVQIPLVGPRQQMVKYQQIYDLIRKRRAIK